jgi:Gluconate 2-dehydrogenase subunit 3
MSAPADLTRRDVLKITAGAVAASQVAALKPAFAAGSAPRFFTPDEMALVDELTEIIIPADDHSPGARAAAVAPFIDGQLADAFQDAPRTTWRTGLASVNALAQSLHGQPFMQLTPDQRVEVVTKMAANEEKPVTDAEKFFHELKRRTVHAYYSSDIGIHKEMEYKGNTLLQEFVGTDVSQSHS